MDNSWHEKKLLDRTANGDEQAFTELFNAYHSAIYSTALRLLQSESAAEEVVQDVFLDIWLQRGQLPQINNFGAWLNRLSRNTIFSAFRKTLKQEHQPLSDLAHAVGQNDIEDQLVGKDYHAIWSDAIARLSPRQKEAYQLVRQQGLKRNEAATIMKVSPETVKFNLDEATRKVRAYCLARLKYLQLLIASMLFID